MTVDGERQREFEARLREHRRIVFKVSAVYARGAADRDDLAQDIAAQLWVAFPKYDGRRAKFSTWMYRIALNVAISHVRAQERAGIARTQSLDETCAESVASADTLHEDGLARDQRGAALHAFIARLDPLNRALVLLYLEDRSYAEIADVLGISETNVATKLNRIKQKLRGQMTTAETTGDNHGTR